MAQALRQSGEQLSQVRVRLSRRRASRRARPTGSSGWAGTWSGRAACELLRDVEDFARRRPWMIAGIGLVAQDWPHRGS